MQFWLCIIGIWCLPLWACSGPELAILVGVDKPPYIDIKSQSGFELELLKHVSQQTGRCARFLHVPNGRLLEQFNEGQADLVSLQRTVPDGLHATAPYIRYENVLIIRKDAVRSVRRLSDLAGKRLMAFQNASQFLTDDYRRMLPLLASYQEVVEQQKLPSMLLKKRVDALVMDRNIFEYYYRQTAPEDSSLQQLHWFGVNSYHLLGRDPQLVQQFSQALQQFQQTDAFYQLQLQFFRQANQ
ncbi:transporter substrate-binding domain-containing protein [Rheinheimera sp.]|uniref:substrate-binding periplasmic protein n=1 Tax=Rheinheimera sp. TaxID=1869214 RepID=UPI00307E7C27